MKGAVVYDKERLATVSKNMSNRWMGETLCRLLGFELRDVSEDLSEYGVAVFRTEDYAGRKRLEERGGRAFNNAQTGMIGNDKKLAYEFTAKLGIASCKWTSVSDEAEYPCIVKSRFGHGGKEVIRCLAKGGHSSKADAVGDKQPVKSQSEQDGKQGNETIAAQKRDIHGKNLLSIL